MADLRRRASPEETVVVRVHGSCARHGRSAKPWWVVLIGAALALASADPASACSCVPVDRQVQVPAVSVIFVGEVTRMPDPIEASDSIGARVRYRFRVIEVLKGRPDNPATLSTAASPAACGVLFSPGERYLVFAHERAGELQTTLCDFNESGPEVDRVAAEVRRILARGDPRPSDP